MILNTPRDIKQYIVVRKDLDMDYGKFGSQVAHAAMKVFADRLKFYYYESMAMSVRNPSDFSFIPDEIDTIKMNAFHEFTRNMMMWMDNENFPQFPFTKIICEVKNEEKLLELYEKVKAANIVCALITDNGNTVFKETCPECEGKGFKQKINEEASAMGPNGEIRGIQLDYIECKRCGGKGNLNKPTNTCISIGPDDVEILEPFTKRLRLYKGR